MVCAPGRPRHQFRAWSVALVIGASALLIAATPSAHADHEGIAGLIQYGHAQNRATACLAAPSEGCHPVILGTQIDLNGFDRYFFEVPDEARNHWFWVNGTGSGYNLNIYFWKANNAPAGDKSGTEASEQGWVPNNAEYAIILLVAGANVQFSFEWSPTLVNE